MATNNKPKFGTNFKPRASIGNKTETTKNIGFGNISEEDKKELRFKLDSGRNTEIKESTPIDISSFIPNTDYIIKKIPRSKLKPAPEEWNFFSKPDKKKLLRLAESIYYNGLLQPIIVREMNSEGNIYQILAGHSRDEAYNVLYDVMEDPKYLEIEAIIFKYGSISDTQAEDIICDTNFMQRGNLPAREMAKCVYLKAKRLKEKTNYGSGDVADKIAEEYKIKRTSVFMWKKLANLIPEFQDLIDNRKITLKNAYKLASLSEENQKTLYNECSNYISNESVRSINTKDNIEDIIKQVENNFGVEIRSFRYEIPENKLHNPKDEALLLFLDPKKKERILELLNQIDGLYFLS